MSNEVRIPTPKVAILMASYNGTLYIKEQIESILKQSGVEVHLFISVDLSTDDTHEICNRYEQKNHNVTVLKYGGRFGGAGRNFYRLIRDVNFSNYDFVALSDQDDIWKPGKLFQAVNIMQNNELAAYSSDVIAFWGNGREKLVKKSYYQKEFDYYFESAGPGCSYVFKRQALQEFKDFLLNKWHRVNSVESHDWLIYAFFRSRNMPWCIDNKVLMRYRQHESNQIGSNFGLKAYIKRTNMINNGWYRSEVEKIYNVVGVSGCKVFNLDRKFLISNFYKLRRRNRDVFILLVMLLIGLF
jgi:rhamnosyltransferase